MNTWFSELQTRNVSLGIRIEDVLWHEKTQYQELAVLQTEAYGRMLVLDGAIQTTTQDEFVYHEMITHVPLLLHPNPRRVAVIGGGDGGAIREILKQPGIEEAHLIEIDEKVMEASKRFFPEIAQGLEDDRAHVHFTDGIAWVKQARDFDVIIVDSTDPVGPAEGLFAPEFYQNIYDALSRDGIMVAQSESPFLEPDIIQRVVAGVSRSFPVTRLYLASVPTYPSGLWSFTLGSKQPLRPARRVPLETRYWTPNIQDSCFHLPRFVEDLIR
ncbi:MAG: polyamine aminopropyltransferase [Firmicutes bacterium]|jgi:spermidine synthase|uniref:Polyamine aminopropyltransferase n=1 Tax=Sulfobacillus benefaciens TaxID=453960 RepID=A0A2T2WYW2_9FIRM|nr:polyamine aminopropyltransferase [Bacillota bacterium]MCL5012379.1 polyamine aminopropyltransferase [Bacillota bacterium]PSR27425.1 MAG: spermidine synthase [Sulfobacillus benefaciens]HBQ96186.1 spermidine synthase [Sulfobacillus sp.]